MATLVLTVIGDDRAGLVARLSQVVADHDGNWERSHLAELAGKFAGIVVVGVPDPKAAELTQAVRDLDGLLDVAVHSAAPDIAAPDPATVRLVRLSVVGDDRPGIVQTVTEIVARHGLNIEQLATDVREAPMAGGLLFEAFIDAAVARDDDLDGVRADLEAIAGEVMVDISSR